MLFALYILLNYLLNLEILLDLLLSKLLFFQTIHKPALLHLYVRLNVIFRSSFLLH